MKEDKVVITEEILMSAVIVSSNESHEHYKKELIFKKPENSLSLYKDRDFKFRLEKLNNLFNIYESTASDGGGFYLNQNYDFHIAQGEYCELKGDPEKALQSYQWCILNGFFYPEPWLHKARIYLIHSQYDNALREARGAVEMQDQNDESDEPGIVTFGKYLIDWLLFSSTTIENHQIDDGLNKIRDWFDQL